MSTTGGNRAGYVGAAARVGRIGTHVLLGFVLVGLGIPGWFALPWVGTPRQPCFGPTTVYAQSDRAAVKQLEQEIAVAKRMLRSGQSSAALEKLRTLLDANPTDVRLLRLYSAQLRTEERLEEAIPYYQKAVKSSEDAGPILQELEGIYRELRKDEEAFDACLEYQARFGERGRWVQRELESLILTGRLGDTAVEKIDEALKDRDAESPLHRLRLSALYFAGRKEEALQAVQKLDKDRKAGGAELYAYSTLLEERGDLDDSLGALQAALLANPNPALGQEMLYKQAQLLRRLRRVDDALVVFDQIVSANPQGALTRNILLEKAQILDVELHRKEDALTTYRELLSRVQPIKTADDAQLVNRIQLAMADCELLLGRPERAGELYQQMSENATDPGVRVESLFQVAEMLFYQGKATEAEETYYKIIDEYKTSTWTNDALDRILIIGENNDFGGVPLSALAQTMYYARLGQVDRALRIATDAIEGFPESEARDNLLYEKTALQLRLGNPIEARSTADQLAEQYPESAFAPRGLKIVADYYRELTGSEETAKAIYTDILLRFPKSIEIPEVRGHLNVLEGRGSDSSALEGGLAHSWLG
ncbi:MAG: tetratricopeptide repeat protein [Candidatus Eisenbacteria bacterium]|nr:tetratricopeptide repeat protein [Candidatus Eisenbacteria bacterium]